MDAEPSTKRVRAIPALIAVLVVAIAVAAIALLAARGDTTSTPDSSLEALIRLESTFNETFSAGSRDYGEAIFDGTQFASIGHGIDGPMLRTSTDGLTWDEQPVPDAPSGSLVSELLEFDGTYAAVIQPAPNFDSTQSPTLLLTVSRDLETWTTTELPAVATNGRNVSLDSGLALGESGIVIPLLSQVPFRAIEEKFLVENGLLTNEDLPRYCGLGQELSMLEVTLCDEDRFARPDAEETARFEQRWAEAETAQARAEVEAEFDVELSGREVVATVTPSDPLFDELSEIQAAAFSSDLQSLALVGPLDGPFTLVELPWDWFPSIVDVDGGFVLRTRDGRDANIYSSADGLEWTRTATVENASGMSPVVLGDSLLGATIVDGESTRIDRSIDGGTIWTSTELESSLHGGFPQLLTGPAGAVVFRRRTTEPTEPPPALLPVSVRRDGFVLEKRPGKFAPATLTGPDGEVLHRLSSVELELSNGNIEGVVRSDPVDENPTFLDPVTGADLVTFTNQDFLDARAEFEEGLVDRPATVEVLFSADGDVWTAVSDDRLVSEAGTQLSPVAVTNSELIVARNTWTEPPGELVVFEAEGREPTYAQISEVWDWELSGGGNSFEFFAIELG